MPHITTRDGTDIFYKDWGGRDAQPNDMDTHVDDLMQLTDQVDLRDAIHVGHSTGGGEATRHVARARG